MFSRLDFLIDNERIEFHTHEIIKVMQQVISEAKEEPIAIPDYSSYPEELQEKVTSLMQDITYKIEVDTGIDKAVLVTNQGKIGHVLFYMLEFLYKTNMSVFAMSGLLDSYISLLNEIKHIERKCLITKKIEEDILLPPYLTDINTLSKWLFISRYLAANYKNVPIIAWWIVISDRFILLRNAPAKRQHFYVSDHGFVEDVKKNIKTSLFRFTRKEIPYFENGTAPFLQAVYFLKRFHENASPEKIKILKDHFIRILSKNFSNDEERNLFLLLTLSLPNMMQRTVLSKQMLAHPESMSVGYTDQYDGKWLQPIPDQRVIIEEYDKFEKIYNNLIEKIRYMADVQAKTFIDLAFERSLNPFFTQIDNIFHPDDADKFKVFIMLAKIAETVGTGYQEFLFRPAYSFGSREEGESYRNFSEALESYFHLPTAHNEQQLAIIMREALRGKSIDDESLYFLPNLIAAWFISEVARNEVSILSGLMLLDLMESNIPLFDRAGNNLYSWKHVLIHPQKPPRTMTKVMIRDLYGDEIDLGYFDGSHPMVHRDSVPQSKTKLGKGQKLSAVRQKEGSLAVHWLYERIKQDEQIKQKYPDMVVEFVNAETSPLVYKEEELPDYGEIETLLAAKKKASSRIKSDSQLNAKWHVLHNIIIPFLRQRLSTLDNLLLPYQPYTSELRTGLLNGETAYFKPIPNNGVLLGRPGSCGFISLGTDRSAVLKTLHDHISDHNDDKASFSLEIRRPIGEQICNDYRNYCFARDILKMDARAINADPRYTLNLSEENWSRLETVTKANDDAERERSDIISNLRKIYSIEEQTSVEELTAILTAMGEAEHLQSVLTLSEAQKKCLETKKNLEDFLSDEGVIKDYLDQNIQEGWLGAYVALAWARAENRTLRMWQPKTRNSLDIVLIQGLTHFSASDENPTDVIHTGVHYERLERQSRVFPPRRAPLPPVTVSPESKNLPGRLHKGLLNSTAVYFKPIPNDGVLSGRPGSCGFISLRTDRSAVLKTLHEHISDHNDNKASFGLDIRRPIGEQICNDYRNYCFARDILKMDARAIHANPRYVLNLSEANWSRLETVTKANDDAERERSDIISNLRKIYSIEEQTSVEELTAILTAMGEAEHLQGVLTLSEAQKKCSETKKDLEDFLSDEGLIKDYLDQNIQEGWLGAYVALAWARAENRTLRMWQPKTRNSSDIVLIQGLTHFSAFDVNPIDVIHTGSHYERLEQLEIPKIDETRREPVTKKLTTLLRDRKKTNFQIHTSLVREGFFSETPQARKKFYHWARTSPTRSTYRGFVSLLLDQHGSSVSVTALTQKSESYNVDNHEPKNVRRNDNSKQYKNQFFRESVGTENKSSARQKSAGQQHADFNSAELNLLDGLNSKISTALDSVKRDKQIAESERITVKNIERLESELGILCSQIEIIKNLRKSDPFFQRTVEEFRKNLISVKDLIRVIHVTRKESDIYSILIKEIDFLEEQMKDTILDAHHSHDVESEFLEEQEKAGHYSIAKIEDILAKIPRNLNQHCLLTVMPQLLAVSKRIEHQKIETILPLQIKIMQDLNLNMSCMISTGLGSNWNSHFITLVIVDDMLLVVDPAGYKPRDLKQLEEIRRANNLRKIVVSNKELQKTDKSSCGPISVEIATFISKTPIENIRRILNETKEITEAGITFSLINIAPVLPQSLENCDTPSINRIRESHNLLLKQDSRPSDGQRILNQFYYEILEKQEQREAPEAREPKQEDSSSSSPPSPLVVNAGEDNSIEWPELEGDNGNLDNNNILGDDDDSLQPSAPGY